MPGTRKRGRPVRVPEEWLQQVRAWKGTRSLRVISEELAAVMGREKPMSLARIHAYLHGKSTTEELTEAFARAMHVQAPGAHLRIADPEMRRWLDIGERLKAEHPQRFHNELLTLSEIVEFLERTRR